MAQAVVEDTTRWRPGDRIALHAISQVMLPSLRQDFAGRGPWARLLRLRTQFNAMLAEQVTSGRRCPASAEGTILGQLLAETYRDADHDV